MLVNKKNKSGKPISKIFGALACNAILVIGLATNTSADNDSLIHSIVKAPIVSDGNVAHRQTDFVMNLATFADPSGPGFALNAGDEVHVELPDGIVFDNLSDFPVCGVGLPCGDPAGSRVCLPGTLACTTVVFLQGYPQSAVPPNVDLVGNTLVLTARADVGPVVKQIHFLGKGTTNPGPGNYWVNVAHMRDGQTLAEGSGMFIVRPNTGPSINVTSVFASISGMGPPFANTVLQGVASGMTAYPWNFLIWDGYDQPFMGITLERRNDRHYQLRQNGSTVGQVTIDAPKGASGFSLSLAEVSTMNTPVIGVGPGQPPSPPPLTQRYTAQFDAGTEPASGCYVTTFRLNNGNRIGLYVGVPTTDACAD
jgi:hypothetical protein